MARTSRAFPIALIAALIAFGAPARACECEHHDHDGLVLNGQINTADFSGGVGNGADSDSGYGGYGGGYGGGMIMSAHAGAASFASAFAFAHASAFAHGHGMGHGMGHHGGMGSYGHH